MGLAKPPWVSGAGDGAGRLRAAFFFAAGFLPAALADWASAFFFSFLCLLPTALPERLRSLGPR